MELYNEAIKYIAEKGVCTTGIIQRRFNIGYQQASEIVAKLLEKNVISRTPRGMYEVLVAPDEVDEYLESESVA